MIKKEPDKFTSYVINKELNLIICNFQGSCTMNDLIALNIKFTSDPDYDPDYDVFLDYTDSKALVFRIEISDYIDFFIKTIKLKKKVRVGNYFETPNQDFLLKVYKGFGVFLNLDIENFYYFDDYIAWMKFDDEQANRIKELLI